MSFSDRACGILVLLDEWKSGISQLEATWAGAFAGVPWGLGAPHHVLWGPLERLQKAAYPATIYMTAVTLTEPTQP